MSSIAFNARNKGLILIWSLLLLSLVFASCGGKTASYKVSSSENQDALDSDKEEESDTLVYDVDDSPLTEAVDESFSDFFYTFLNRKSFQLQRVAYPVDVLDEHGLVVETLRNGKSVVKAMDFSSFDYLVMLLGEKQDPYDYLNSDVSRAEVKKVELSACSCRTFTFLRQDKEWMFSNIQDKECSDDEQFLRFYYKFANDSIFREDHLAPEIMISLPSDDEMDIVNGNIDSGQWDVFAPELPKDQILMLVLGEDEELGKTIKFVKCSLASSMLEVLTFERESNDWKLVRYEE